ncbi:hypothetical protein C0992_003729 [Termitomyces sp. T32_za158]|nr:hypothetical protein C0992_003729 [Termitomyces sp. T32_za158]
MATRCPTPTIGRALRNPCTPHYLSNPTRNPNTGLTNAQDRSIVPLLANDPRLTGVWVPPIILTTPKYSPGDSPKPHPIIGTPFLALVPEAEEFARRAQTLLLGLGQKYPNSPLEDWAHHLLDFNDQGATERLPESVHEDLRQNAFMCNKLHSLIDKIHVSPNPGVFEDPMDPARSFHVQRGAPFYLGDAARIPGQRNQEEQNAASGTLCTLNPNGSLFEQLAARTIGLSTRQRANSVPSAV